MDTLGLPRKLHRLHEFQLEDKWFFADLVEGVVLPTPEPMRQILHRCESHTKSEILAGLGNVFDRNLLERTFLMLEALDSIGYLFSSVKKVSSKAPIKQLYLCVSPNFLLFKPQTDFITRWVYYNLLAALAKYAHISLILPKLTAEKSAGISFLSEGVERIPIDDWAMHNILQAVPSDCDGVLLLSPLSTNDLIWYRHVDVPVVSYVQSETLAWRKDVNILIQHAAVMRNFDAIVGDAPWIPSLIQGTVEEMPSYTLILPGADNFLSSSEGDKVSFWTKLQDQFPYKELGKEALVGITWEPCSPQWASLLTELCLTHRNWTFVIFHPFAKMLIGNRLPNLICLDLFSYNDLMILHAFVSQMDAFVYQCGPGIAILPLLIALSTSCPTLVCGKFQGLVKKMDIGSRLFHLETDPTVDSLSNGISLCFVERQTPRHPVSFSWMETAQSLVQIFQQCHDGSRFDRSARYMGIVKPLFHYHYVKSKGKIEIASHLLPGFSNVSLKDGLRLALESGQISSNEIQVILKRLCP